jgi:hypothetical protein
MMEKSLDRKLAAIHSDPNSREFILADAKDADMAFGIGAPGLSPESHPGEVRHRTLAEYRELIRANVRQGIIDIMLMSASTNHALTIEERLFVPTTRPTSTSPGGQSTPSIPRIPFDRPASTMRCADTWIVRPTSATWALTSVCTA